MQALDLIGPLMGILGLPALWNFGKQLLSFIQEWRAERKEKKGVKIYDRSKVDLTKDILALLYQIMRGVGADRCYLGEFHNGGKWGTGESQVRYTMRFEVVSPGTSYRKPDEEAILVDHVSAWYDELISDRFRYQDISQIEDQYVLMRAKRCGIISTVNAPIYDARYKGGRVPRFFIGLDWTKGRGPDPEEMGMESSEKAYRTLQEHGNSIKRIL